MIRKNVSRIALVSAALFLAALAVSAARSLMAADQQDSEQITGLFQQIKESSAQLATDSDTLVTFVRSGTSWESHAQALNQIKEHVNQVGKLEQELRDARESGSAWQQEAIGRVNPLLHELANNLETTINHLNESKSALATGPYREYVQTNADLAGELHSMISNFVSYGKTKKKFQDLQNKLELAER